MGTATTTTTAAPPTTVPVGVTWRSCQSGSGPGSGPAGQLCASLSVPLDYQNTEGPKITLALDRHPATGVKYGSLLINPGGPGASGVDFLESAVSTYLSSSLLQHFDVIGFDPRGVSRSAPIHCVDGAQMDKLLDMDPAPPDDAGFQALIDADRSFDQACQARSGSLLPYVGTENAARDMDAIRQAVGDDKLSYLGFSYGTFLGATYADLFPTHIRAMVLDGAVDPALDPITFNIAQSTAFDKELNAFFGDCAARPSCGWKPSGDLHAAYDALMARIRAQRLPGDGTRTVGPGEAFFGVALPLYDRATWPQLAQALNAADHGDGSILLQFFDEYANRSPGGTYTNQVEANNAVNCLDSAWPRDPAELRKLGATARQQAPEFGVADLYGGLTCSLWPVRATGHPHAIRADGSPTIVVVGSTGDPATPYAQAKSLASELAHGVLITRVGDGHTGYRSSSCVRQYVDAYLLSLSSPPVGLNCASP
jgi:pimeloyl-ACP methyl ester carboxylesterase